MILIEIYLWSFLILILIGLVLCKIFQLSLHTSPSFQFDWLEVYVLIVLQSDIFQLSADQEELVPEKHELEF